MTSTHGTRVEHERFARTLRTVMWLDAALSVGLVLVCAIASPVLATLGVPRGILDALGVAALVCAVLLAAFGAITAILLMLRMHDGDYLLPPRLRLPLPPAMHPMRADGLRDRSR